MFSITKFKTDWCPPCDELDDYLKEHSIDIKFDKVVDCDEEGDLCLQYEIFYVPTVIVFIDDRGRMALVGWEKSYGPVLKALAEVQKDPELINVLRKVFDFADEHDLKVNIRMIPAVVHYRGKRCPCRPNVHECPCSDALEFVEKKGRCYCGLFRRE